MPQYLDPKTVLIFRPHPVLQYTLYVCRNVHLGFLNFLSYMFCFCSAKYSELFLAGISQKSQNPPPLPPPPEIHRLDPTDLKIYALAKNLRL
jgi:hypothetical protein